MQQIKTFIVNYLSVYSALPDTWLLILIFFFRLSKHVRDKLKLVFQFVYSRISRLESRQSRSCQERNGRHAAAGYSNLKYLQLWQVWNTLSDSPCKNIYRFAPWYFTCQINLSLYCRCNNSTFPPLKSRISALNWQAVNQRFCRI